MKAVMTVAVYGNYKKNDINIAVFPVSTTDQYQFQNILRKAGYDCELFVINDEDINPEG